MRICIIEKGEVWGKDIITVYILSPEMEKQKHSISTMKESVRTKTASLEHERVLNL